MDLAVPRAPAGTPLCKDGRREFPDHDLAAWIEQYQPDVVFCGHIHQAPGCRTGSWNARLGRTWVFNPGKQVDPIPPNITLDTTRGPPIGTAFRVRDDQPRLRLSTPVAHGTRLRGPALVMHQAVEDLIDHPEVPGEPGKLLLDVHQVLRQAVQAHRGHPKDCHRGTRVVVQERVRILDDAHLDRRRGPDRRRGRPSSTHDISPKTAPGWSIRAKGTRSFSIVTDPEFSTNIRDGRSALHDQDVTLGHGRARGGRSSSPACRPWAPLSLGLTGLPPRTPGSCS